MKIRSYKHKTYLRNRRLYYKNPVLNNLLPVTPEEQVRQDVIRTLNNKYGYPYYYMYTEFPIPSDGRNLRADIALFLPSKVMLEDGFWYSYHPYIIIECKAASVTLNDDHLQQGLKYCEELCAFYLVLSNGRETVCYVIDDNGDPFLIDDIPSFSEALQSEVWTPKDFVPETWGEGELTDPIQDTLWNLQRDSFLRNYHKK